MCPNTLPFVYSPPLPSNLLSPKGIMSKWIKSHRPALKSICTWHWDLTKSQCLWKLTDTKRQLCSELSQELQASACAMTGPPSTCVVSSCHCDTVATEPHGIHQPIFFKSFLSVIALLQMFLAKLGHFLECLFTRSLFQLLLRLRTIRYHETDPLTL